eukprot:CAMPEP_0177640956 /NCGR_PEP_ID=MMETSP0447-20121125/6817_1 /TAXON_ID=0 /ORGANISM="Stygamoeba regulata, Strain BSH-02190019" /LENGTH=101 /DNA_ID=CAMNT_0019143057 /DNA_START=82 /DNA_END=387 /DNA_ORIENTATION=+
MKLSLVLLALVALIAVAYALEIQPTRVTDPIVLRRLDCQMNCRTDEDAHPDCFYRCLSMNCYEKVFGSMIVDGVIEGHVSEKRNKKFEKCWTKEYKTKQEL